ncbi:hypothetical protein JAAARDRAFT_32224 [Jaapia argillacea MUCL 33604]|uniref:ABM domain-containing protein n=1 Tax=Jaapia argillacea MUCL 33604 TaxID=933084 RepID=A0A067QCJ1_9AGAM|nr:hypothetical protein JAAARDRAFT_32224 [Jaapia argillacea MUCL 33604]
MTITEFACLQFTDPKHTFHSPDILSLFRMLSERQSTWSTYPLLFLQSKPSEPGNDSPALIYLMTGWEDEAAHWEWIKSEENQALVGLFGPCLEIRWMVHLDCEFDETKMGVENLVFKKVDGSPAEKVLESEVGWFGRGDLESRG